jgi:hypothetical protein
MKRILFLVLVTGLFTGVALAQSSGDSQTKVSASQNTTASAETSGQIAPGSIIPAELAKSVDAKKAKPGDQVVAKTTQDMLANGHVVVPRGAKILGHVTQAKAREKGENESTLGIAFDKVVMKDGRELPLNASIQALAAAQSTAALNSGPMAEPAGAPAGMGPGRSSNSGVIGGTAQTAGNVAGAATSAAGNVGSAAGSTVGSATGAATNARLNTNSQGVVGLSGLSLTGGADSAQGAVISSQNKNVKLDSGTQMMLRVNGK